MSKALLILITAGFMCLPGAAWANPAPQAAPDAAKAAKPVKAAPGEKVDQADFLKGYALFLKQDYREACPYLYRYVAAYTPDAEDYEWAEFFLGVSLKKLGYSHAAEDILARLVSRKPNPRIVEYSLEIFESMSRSQPFDRDLLIRQTVCDQDFGYLDEGLGDFVDYYQGLYDWEHGFMAWGDEHFARITPGSYYHCRYLDRKALLLISRNDIAGAAELLTQVLASEGADEALKDEARITLARLLYEQGKFKDSDVLYQTVEENILSQSQNLLERAWAHYRMGHPEKAMGLLYAYEAPSFKGSMTPEYYMLKSFIYKDVCHYQRALDVVDEFTGHFGPSLKGISSRAKVSDNRDLLLLLLNRKDIKRTWDFIQLLEKERGLCAEFRTKTDTAFFAYLDGIYALQIEESSHELKAAVEKEYARYADSLLQYEEEAHLMAYEIGLDMYQRVNQSHFAEDRKKDARDKGTVVYPFQGEFWNDELADLKVVLPNKCTSMDEWDILAK